MNNNFLDLMIKRRSIYKLGKEPGLRDDQIEQLLADAIKHAPTAYNSQLTRLVLLLHKEHDLFWDLVMDSIREVNPNSDLSKTEKKLTSFQAAYGTILFYNDQSVTKKLQEDFPLYKNHFSDYAQHGSAILQYAVWCLLADVGIGASLQHYNPIVDSRVQKEWNIHPDWQLIAQMPFGNPLAGGGDKEFMPIEERLFVYK